MDGMTAALGILLLNPFQVTITHINDHHSHLQPTELTLEFDGVPTEVEVGGFPRVTAIMKQLEKSRRNVLKVHAGDAITGGLFYTLFKGEADAGLMNTVCFDAFALGNHEFDDGDTGLKSFLDHLHDGECQTAVLAANVLPEVGVSPLALTAQDDYLSPYSIVNIGGEQIGLIGINIASKTKNSSNPGPTTEFLDEAATA